jgi:hypothetical protein
VVEQVKVTVAAPVLFIVDVGAAKLPPVPVTDQVTVLPDATTALPLTSLSCAVTARALPTVGADALEVTKYFAAAPAVVVIVGDMPLTPLLSDTDTVKAWPATVPVVTVTVAIPLLVADVALLRDPEPPDRVHVTVRPDSDSGPLASASCAVIVTCAPATGLDEDAVTM